MNLINQFAEEHPNISVRQITIRLGEITTKDMPKCITQPTQKKGVGRAFMFFLRPRFYKYLPEEDRPQEWERYAEEDERKWQEEKEAAKAESKASSVTADSASEVNSLPANGVSPSVLDEDEEETEDEGEPVTKRLKVDS